PCPHRHAETSPVRGAPQISHCRAVRDRSAGTPLHAAETGRGIGLPAEPRIFGADVCLLTSFPSGVVVAWRCELRRGAKDGLGDSRTKDARPRLSGLV